MRDEDSQASDPWVPKKLTKRQAIDKELSGAPSLKSWALMILVPPVFLAFMPIGSDNYVPFLIILYAFLGFWMLRFLVAKIRKMRLDSARDSDGGEK